MRAKKIKNALVFGDSYSTFKGHVPEGYEIYYSEDLHTETGVTKAEWTWWYQVAKEKGLKLVLNDSWSGSPIGYTGHNRSDCSTSSSFIFRLRKLIQSGFFEENKIDTVFVFGGTNDSWSNAPLGEVNYECKDEGELFFVLPAISYFLKLLSETLPEADIYCLINTDMKDEITSLMKAACEKYRITPVTFESIDKVGGHPTKKGMQEIKDAVILAMG